MTEKSSLQGWTDIILANPKTQAHPSQQTETLPITWVAPTFQQANQNLTIIPNTDTHSSINPFTPSKLTPRKNVKSYIPQATLTKPRYAIEYTIHCHTCLVPLVVSSKFPLDMHPNLTCPVNPTHKVEVRKTDGWDHMAMQLCLPRPLALNMLNKDKAIYTQHLTKMPGRKALANRTEHERPPHATQPTWAFKTNAEWAAMSMKSLQSFTHGASAQTLTCHTCAETFTFFINLDNPRFTSSPLSHCPRCGASNLHPTELNTEDAAFVFLAEKYNISLDYIKALYQMFEQQNKYSRFNDYMKAFRDSMEIDISKLTQA